MSPAGKYENVVRDDKVKSQLKQTLPIYVASFSVSSMPIDQISYSEKYTDEKYEYRHVILPSDIARMVPKNHLMTETEWRNLGVQQSPGWVHYMVHSPEPHVLLFRRQLPQPIVPPKIPLHGQQVAAH